MIYDGGRLVICDLDRTPKTSFRRRSVENSVCKPRMSINNTVLLRCNNSLIFLVQLYTIKHSQLLSQDFHDHRN